MDVDETPPAEQLANVSAPSAAVMITDTNSESDEWEYEYSTTETEVRTF